MDRIEKGILAGWFFMFSLGLTWVILLGWAFVKLVLWVTSK